MTRLHTSFSTLFKNSSDLRCSKCLDKARIDEGEDRLGGLVTLRPHVLGLKSALSVAAVLEPTQSAEHVLGINKGLAAYIVGEPKSRSNESCRCNGFENHSINDLDAVVQELRTTIRMLDNMVANVVDEVKSCKSNAEELSSDVKDVRASLIGVREKQWRMERIITFSRLSSSCYYR